MISSPMTPQKMLWQVIRELPPEDAIFSYRDCVCSPEVQRGLVEFIVRCSRRSLSRLVRVKHSGHDPEDDRRRGVVLALLSLVEDWRAGKVSDEVIFRRGWDEASACTKRSFMYDGERVINVAAQAALAAGSPDHAAIYALVAATKARELWLGQERVLEVSNQTRDLCDIFPAPDKVVPS